MRLELAPAQLSPKTAWWRSCFEEGTLRHESRHVRSRVEAMAEILQLEPRSRLLDLGCGLGQETEEFARRGHRVLGADETEEGLREARAATKGTSLFCHFVKVDPRNIPYTGEFDAVLVRNPSFGHFPRERDDLRCLEGIRKSLKPNGRLLMKLVNRDWVIRHLPAAPLEPGLRFDFASGRLERSRASTRGPASLRLYSLTELLRLLDAAGLALRRVWGRLDGTPYGLDTFHMVVLAERPREVPRAKDDGEEGLARALKVKGRGR
ncbi:MAG: class I SAM-dependent methyltransferase [Elusimicrobia bacterium]|nr:class I SAM-dependent methyltransferase [Elusimicrobiota bacterium]